MDELKVYEVSMSQEEIPYNLGYRERAKLYKERQIKISADFYKVINAIVAAGGSIRASKRDLNYVYDLTSCGVFRAVIPKSKIEELLEIPEVANIKEKAS